jgi:hypothetical protein
MGSGNITGIDFLCEGIDALAPPHISDRSYSVGREHECVSPILAFVIV